jgi:hypothetical protein
LNQIEFPTILGFRAPLFCERVHGIKFFRLQLAQMMTLLYLRHRLHIGISNSQMPVLVGILLLISGGHYC